MPPTPAKKTTAAKKTAAKKTTAARSATARKVAQPTDHASATTKAAPKPNVVKLHGKDWTVDPAAADDFELLEDLGQLDRTGDPSRMPAVLRKILGDKQYDEAMDTLRDKETGRVGLEAGVQFVWDLFEGLAPNSSSS